MYEIKTKAISITTDTWPGLYLSTQIEGASEASVTAVYRHVLTTDDAQKRQLEVEIDADHSKLDRLMKDYEATSNTAEDRRIFASMVNTRIQCEASYKPVIDLSEKGKSSDAEALLHSQLEPACGEFLKWVNAQVDDNKVNGDESNRRVLAAVGAAQIAVPIGLIVGFLLAVISSYILVKDFSTLIGGVQQLGLQVGTSSAEIAATSQEQLSTANEIAATTSEIGATSKQISVTSKELVQTMKDVADVAEKTAVLASSGQSGLGRMKSTVQQIVDASASITDRLAVLNEKAGNIGTVVTTITKVADQTNLLSLNAAIEAEKAGEYGRGFAVVATEIRRLADQTAVSTSDIEQTVKEMQSAVAAGVMGMDKFSEEVRKGVDVVGRVSEELSQIIQQVQAIRSRS
jgi:methyl-accepting chemotaxis protein WspA